jgi:hypothetical protein
VKAKPLKRPDFIEDDEPLPLAAFGDAHYAA